MKNKELGFDPILIKAGDKKLGLGIRLTPPQVDCRVVAETRYQKLIELSIKNKTLTTMNTNLIELVDKHHIEIRELKEKATTYLRELSNLEEGWDEELEKLSHD